MGLLCGGGNISLEVQTEDTIALVKRKLQDTHDIPVENQGLALGWKRLQDTYTLEDYNIQQFSTLELRYQKSQPPEPEEDMTKTNNEPVVHEKWWNDWNAVAGEAKKLFEIDLEKKKMLFNKLKEEKNKSLENIINIEADIIKHDNYLEKDLKELDCIEKEIDASQSTLVLKKQEVRKLEELISKDLEKKDNLRTDMNQKRSMRENRRKEILDINKHIERLEMDMKQLFSDDGQNKKLVEENNKEKEENSALKTFLSESIATKESLLECPVCFTTASPPIYKCLSEHLICSKCLPRMKGKCPTCRTRISGSETRFRLAEENYKELQKIQAKLDAL